MNRHVPRVHRRASFSFPQLATTVAPAPSGSVPQAPAGRLPAVLTVALFVLLYAQPLAALARDWWNNPDAGHGLLLAPVACWLAWRRGLRAGAAPDTPGGMALVVAAVLLRYLSSLAAELFTTRLSVLLALAGLVVFAWGWRQLLAWWLPALLLLLSIPLPEVVLSGLAMPLQFQASELGASLLRSRGIPVRLDGNVIQLPGHALFVTEACSGLRSLTALLALGVLLGGLMLRTVTARVAVVLLTLPVAILLNGLRVFLTGYLVVYIDPAMGEGFSHATEGWLMFLVAFGFLSGVSWVASLVERRAIGGAHAR
jgi:exosortase